MTAPQPRRAPDGTPLMANGKPNPTGRGRYCLPPPGTCYCGSCSWWRPIPTPNYVAVKRELADRKARQRMRRTGRR